MISFSLRTLFHRCSGKIPRLGLGMGVVSIVLVTGCIGAAAPSPEEAVSLLMELTHDESEEVRRMAVESLGKIGDHRAVAAITALLMDPSPLVRSAAARAGGRLGSESLREVVPALLQALNDQSDEVRQLAAQALSELDPSPGLLGGIPDLLSSPDVDVRRAAALALVQIDSAEWLPLLHRAIQDPDAIVRQRAVAVLGQNGLPMAASWLRERLLLDADPNVRAEAAYQLRILSDEQTRAALQRATDTDRDPIVRLWARRS